MENFRKSSFWSILAQVGSLFYSFISSVFKGLANLFSWVFSLFGMGSIGLGKQESILPYRKSSAFSPVSTPIKERESRTKLRQASVKVKDAALAIAENANRSCGVDCAEDPVARNTAAASTLAENKYILDMTSVGRDKVPLTLTDGVVVSPCATVESDNFQPRAWYDADLMAFCVSSMRYANTNLHGVLIRPETSYNQYQLINSNGLAGSITLLDNGDSTHNECVRSNRTNLLKSFNQKGVVPVVVNIGESHWTSALLVRDRSRPGITIYYFDSFNSDENKSIMKQRIGSLVAQLAMGDKVLMHVDVKPAAKQNPVQSDGYNCGPWSLEFLRIALAQHQETRRNKPKPTEFAEGVMKKLISHNTQVQYMSNVREGHQKLVVDTELTLANQLTDIHDKLCDLDKRQRTHSPASVAATQSL